MQVIIYGSQYGTAKEYALELSRITSISVSDYENIRNISEYETIIYIGALYAGGVLGLTKTFRKLSNIDNKKIIIATVGLSDSNNEENITNIRNSIKRQISNELYEKAKIFHLRGGIDYAKLKMMHKTMMKLLYKKAITLPEDKKTPEVKAMIDTYNKKVNFVDFSSLDKIVYELKSR